MDNDKLSKWPIFSLLDEAFLRSIRRAAVFGSTANEAVVVTDKDEVFAFGSNNNSCLGLGDNKSTLAPRRVEQLCKKGIVEFVFGSGPHVLAVSDIGEVFSWGHNGYGQLGQGAVVPLTTNSTGGFPQRIQAALSGKKLVKVACGGHHTVALTTEGEVYAWGYNSCGQVGSGNTTNQSTPRKVELSPEGVDCSSIACGQASSVALTVSGKLVTWGCNGNGQLGIGSTTNQSVPCKLHLPGVCIKQVVCGYAHVLALSDDGTLYSWGSNTYGQLGTGCKSNALLPTVISTSSSSKLGRFIHVAACHNSHISAAALPSGKVYMWGACRGQNVLLPLETRFTSLDDVFAGFSTPSCTWRTVQPMPDAAVDNGGLVKCIAGRFDDINTSDLTIVVGERKIFVHKAILRMRCEYFYSMFQQGRWREAEKNQVEISQFSYPVYYAFLKYLYTDKLDDLSSEHVVALCELADAYCEAELKAHCERLMMHRVSVENVASLLAVASKYKTEVLEDHCFQFTLSHMTQVVLSEGFGQLDDSFSKSFIQKAAKQGVFKT